MATATQKEQEPAPTGLSSNQIPSRALYALRTLQIALASPNFSESIKTSMDASSAQASAILKRAGIVNAKGESVETATGLRFYSSDDINEVGKNPVKPAVLIPKAGTVKPAVSIDSPVEDFAIITINPPDLRLLANMFVKNEIFTREESEQSRQLVEQTGCFARFVLLNQPFSEGDSQGNGEVNKFVKAAYFDHDPAVKINQGVNGFLSSIGIGTVFDASRHGDEIHVFESKRGQALETNTWGIVALPGADQVNKKLVARKVNNKL